MAVPLQAVFVLLPLLATGDRVQICDLIHSPQFNGVEGAVEGFDAVTGRYIVRVLGRSRPLRVRASNLVLPVILHPDQPQVGLEGSQLASMTKIFWVKTSLTLGRSPGRSSTRLPGWDCLANN
jgi:hypothetical protein